MSRGGENVDEDRTMDRQRGIGVTLVLSTGVYIQVWSTVCLVIAS